MDVLPHIIPLVLLNPESDALPLYKPPRHPALK